MNEQNANDQTSCLVALAFILLIVIRIIADSVK